MSKKPIVIVYNKLSEKVKSKLERNCEAIYIDKEILESNPNSIQELSKSEGLIGSGLKINESFLEKTPELKVVANISVGYDNLDLEALTKRKILATNTPNVLTESTADAIFGLLIATARRIPELDVFVKDGKWEKSIDSGLFGMDLHHKKLGIIGMGRIGAAIAKRAHLGFDMSILYHNRNRDFKAEKDYKARYCSLEELLKESDFVCVMVPLTVETHNLIGPCELEMLKASAILIVGSRGGIVDEAALTIALQNGKLRAAGLDVYAKEPIDSKHSLLKLKNVVTLPHIGSATVETREKMAFLAVENLIDGLNGKKPSCLINKVF